MPEEDSFQDLIAQLKAGEDEAAAEIFERFAAQLVAKARGRIHAGLRRKIDAEDVVQSAYRTFFRRFDEGKFKLENWDSLWGLLLTITVRKCGRKAEYFHAAQRDIGRERTPNPDSEQLVQCEGIAREPTPQDVAVLTELVDQLMDGLLHESHREILTMSLQGHDAAEIAKETQRSERTVRRVLKFVKQDLEQRIRESDE